MFLDDRELGDLSLCARGRGADLKVKKRSKSGGDGANMHGYRERCMLVSQQELLHIIDEDDLVAAPCGVRWPQCLVLTCTGGVVQHLRRGSRSC